MPVLTTRSGRALELRQFDTTAELDEALATDIAAGLGLGISAHTRASLALSGGSTPLGMIQCLGGQAVAWDRIGITLVDDRWVPLDHTDSNAGMLQRNLLNGDARRAQWVPLVRAEATPEQSLALGNAALDALRWPLDVCVLGMGNDGHTASLFPCANETPAAMALDCPSRIAVVRPTTAPYPRISMTLPSLIQAKHLFLHIVGAQKMNVLQAALNAGDDQLPIARVLDSAQGNCRVYWSA